MPGKRLVILGLSLVATASVIAGVMLGLRLQQELRQAHPDFVGEPFKPVSTLQAPATPPGCWEVAILEETTLFATWLASCPTEKAAQLGELPWLEKPIHLPGLEAGLPALATAQTEATLSPELAEEGEGALLFLPANSKGDGYYVAAWQVEDPSEDESEDVEITNGIVVRRFGAPPPSVPTPAGRVYLARKWTPQGVRESHEALKSQMYMEEMEIIEDVPGRGANASSM